MQHNLLIVHGGGPTAVLNASLYGTLREAGRIFRGGRIWGASRGIRGVLKGRLIDLTSLPEEVLSLLLNTPGSAIGSSRDPLSQEDYQKLIQKMEELSIDTVLMTGGNGTMDTCRKLYELLRAKKKDCRVIGIPKTIDNDLALTDHSPGYGSAANYMARSTRELCMDVEGFAIHAVILEASGRDAGWLAASSALARENGCSGPDLIYCPERTFDQEQFLQDIASCLDKKKGLVAVVSEGLRDRNGDPIVPPIYKAERATYFGDVGTYLAGLIVRELGYKARAEKPGLLGRCSMELVSSVDREEAICAGAFACRAALEGETGKMVSIVRQSTQPYRAELSLADLEEITLSARKLPESFINPEGNGVTEAFVRWCRPLTGSSSAPVISFCK